MKQKTKNLSPVTKEELVEVLKDYPTKDEFSKRLNDSFEAFRQENNHNFQMMMDKFDEKFSKFTNLILTTIDPLLKELETRREDREIGTAQIKRIEDDVENLNKRVAKLEHS